MRVKDYLERLSRSLRDPKTKEVPFDKQQLAEILFEELEYLSGEFQWDWAATPIRPAIRTQASKREYVLPVNFGLNFARGADSRGAAFTVTLSDTTSEAPITYETPAKFYSRNIVGESDSRPSFYTIRSDGLSGRRIMVLSSPPDANGSVGYYNINGLYVPMVWELNDHEQMLPVPGNSSLLKHRVLMRAYETLDPRLHQFHDLESRRALSSLLMAQARSRRTRLMPKLNRTASGNSYGLVRNR
jgi:hypothetical protein